MEKEKSSAEKTKIRYGEPKMLVIKGRRQDHISISTESLDRELKKFIKMEETIAFHLQLPLDNQFKKSMKRLVDIVVSTIVIICLLSWLVPLIALLIKLDSKGPVFFLQKRNGKNGKVFTCIKFRSMIENEDADVLPASEDDERITKFGRFLRDHRFDNLPQFFNVWWGDMSIIGPRSQMIAVNNKYEQLIEFYEYRNKVKPGITGLSRVINPGKDPGDLQAMKNRLQLDIFYMRRWSLSLDIKIAWYAFREFINL